MTNKKAIILKVMLGCMELSWLFAIFSIIFFVLGLISPVIWVMTIYILGAMITSVSSNRGWAIYQVFGLHLLVSTLLTLQFISYFGYSLTGQKDLIEWLVVTLLVIFPYLVWYRGIILGRRKVDYLAIANNFDLGIGIYFLLLVVGAATEMPMVTTVTTLFSFFFWSVVAMSMARNFGSGEKSYIPGFHGVALLLTFASSVVVFALGGVLLFLPYLVALADTSYRLIRAFSEPLMPYFIKVLVFLLGFSVGRSNLGPTETPINNNLPEQLVRTENSGWFGLLGKLLSWGMLAFILVLLLLAIAFLTRVLFKALLARTPIASETLSLKEIFVRTYQYVRTFTKKIFSAVIVAFKVKRQGKEGARLFRELKKWGIISGIAYKTHETPREYGNRLVHRFPQLKKEILILVEVFNTEFYGGIDLPRENIKLAKGALRQLKHPAHWLNRIKVWLFRI